MRRLLITPFLLAALICSVLSFAAAQTKASPPLDPNLGITTIPVWSGHIPGSKSLPADIPTLTVFPPFRPNGTAVIVAPGGGYTMLASNHEGRQVADWFAARGITAFVLKYRLGPHNLFPIPLEDAQRAIRLVRYNALKFHISPDRIGIIGFSAGGHLAALTGTLFDRGDASSSDPIDRVSDRPDFMVLGYAWLNAMEPNQDGKITYCSVLKTVPAADCKQFEKAYTPALHVTARTPPTFIYATSDDKVVPIVRASVDFYDALVAAGVPVEMHLFEHGRHGSGLGLGSPSLDLWPVLLEQWLRGQGLLTTKAAGNK
jgi:acetyl esterase/lipase